MNLLTFEKSSDEDSEASEASEEDETKDEELIKELVISDVEENN